MYIWETSKSAVAETLLLRRNFLSWKWLQTMENDVVNYQKRYLAMQCLEKQLVHSRLCANLELFLFFPNCRQSPCDTRSDTFAIPFWCMNAHESILFLDAWEKISWCPPHMACIEQESKIWPGHHEHRQFQFNIYIYIIYIWLIYIYDLYIYMTYIYILLITISYVHAPNTVKRYSKLRIAIPKSKRAPFTFWILHACIYMYIYMCECVISSLRPVTPHLCPDELHQVASFRIFHSNRLSVALSCGMWASATAAGQQGIADQ